MKFGSLFSGVGGFDLGFERAGMKCEWQVEFDKNCQNILRKHWSETELFDDVRTVGKHNLKPVDVICGGFPCQDVSIAGKRAGLAGERSGLWSEFARIIDELEPNWVVIENVPGLLSSHRGRDFATVIRWLAERGYGVAWRILDSQYFGVAQRRRRVFIVGSFGNGGAAEILFEREGVRWDIEKGRKTGEGVASTVEGGSSKCHSDITGGQQDANVVVMSSGQANAEILSERSPSLTGLHEQPIVAYNISSYSSNSMKSSNPNSGTQIVDTVRTLDLNGGNPACNQGGVMLVLNDQGGSQMSVTENVSAKLRSQEHGHQPIVLGFDLAQITSKANYSNPKVGDPQPPLNTFGQGHIAYKQQAAVRRLTPTECERLQGFPDGWTDGQADSHRYKQMGNAVTVNVAEWIGKRIAEAHNVEQPA
jgi:DNA (cytosine-5)-methyltransferase 1